MAPKPEIVLRDFVASSTNTGNGLIGHKDGRCQGLAHHRRGLAHCNSGSARRYRRRRRVLPHPVVFSGALL